jgi:hypothetical protein
MDPSQSDAGIRTGRTPAEHQALVKDSSPKRTPGGGQPAAELEEVVEPRGERKGIEAAAHVANFCHD